MKRQLLLPTLPKAAGPHSTQFRPICIRSVADGLLSAQSRTMTQSPNNKRPSEKLVGARVRVSSDRAVDATRLFDAGGFAPIYVEHRDDGDVSFWFGKESDDVLYRIATCIPRDFYAVQGAVVGNNPHFSSQVRNDS
jgi:hypothetical protein